MPYFVRLSTIVLCLVTIAIVPLHAQEDSDSAKPPRFFFESTDVRVVNVDVFVTDRSGNPIEGLTQNDFRLLVDGKPMAISNFYAEAKGQVRETVQQIIAERGPDETSFQPIEAVEADPERRAHVVVLIDHSRMQPSNRKRTFNALREAVKQLDPSDLVAMVGVEGSLVFYSEFLYDRNAIGDILDEVQKVRGQLGYRRIRPSAALR